MSFADILTLLVCSLLMSLVVAMLRVELGTVSIMATAGRGALQLWVNGLTRFANFPILCLRWC